MLYLCSLLYNALPPDHRWPWSDLIEQQQQQPATAPLFDPACLANIGKKMQMGVKEFDVGSPQNSDKYSSSTK